MKEAKELFEAIAPIRRQIAKKCLAYLKRELKKNNGSIEFFDNDGNAIDDEYVSVAYDGGRHPEYNSSAFSQVDGIYLNEKGNIVLNIEDDNEYDINNISWDELYDVAEFVYEHAAPYWKNF
jgi:hypothetical protein